MLACVMLAACGQSKLYSNLNEKQANELVAALMGAGIGADKTQADGATGWDVTVSHGDFPRAMQVLAAHRLPSPTYVSMCETFKKEGFASSSLEERARYQCSKEQELAHTLSGIPGVAEARVHVALPERDPLGNETNDASASVTIYQLPGANVRDSETDIKAIVKDGIEGLTDPNKVTVKFYTLGAATQANNAAAGSVLSTAAISPLAIAIIGGALALLAILLAVMGRMRSRRAAEAEAQANARVWNG